ncbi:ogr/Delta-like zinc finger family protein [Moraxella sp. Pampa]|uniref:ogr/Delta-like zinc finger family protein n=1 Tax=Moraxella sp. Pampa TaxID=3111978 RepID=UPI002B407B01|nr:ogr/Delta-like zinc finger family protein [Moraxella sp. Pampa]
MPWICPHCKQKTVRVRTSRTEHILLRRLWVQCQNLSCGWTGTYHCECDGELSPSATPDPAICLPQGKQPPSQNSTPDLFDGADE